MRKIGETVGLLSALEVIRIVTYDARMLQCMTFGDLCALAEFRYSTYNFSFTRSLVKSKSSKC